MSRQHAEALRAFGAASDKAVELYRAALVDEEPEDEGANVTRFPVSNNTVSWTDAMGNSRLVVRDMERLIAHLAAKERPRTVSPKNQRTLIRYARAILADLKAALTLMEALPPWHPPPDDGGGRRKAA